MQLLIIFKAKVYDCEACFLRLKTVTALVEVNKKFMKKGFKIKIFVVIVPRYSKKNVENCF
jgi:hypothetical protein